MLRIPEQDLIHILEKTSDLFQQNSSRNSNFLITGATGFFGKWILEGLIYLNKNLNLDIKLFCLSRNPEEFLNKFPFFREYKFITWIEGNINNCEFPKEKFNYIIHAAADSDALLYSEDPLLMLDTITAGTRRIL
jgi:dTDP-glucose 4,6-dehydratase